MKCIETCFLCMWQYFHFKILKFCILLYQSFWEVISIKRILNVLKINDASTLKCNINTKESVTDDL